MTLKPRLDGKKKGGNCRVFTRKQETKIITCQQINKLEQVESMVGQQRLK